MIEFVHLHNLEQAIEWCTIASHIRPKDPTPHALVGYFFLMSDKINEAKKKFEYIFGKMERSHVFTLLNLAVIVFNGIRPQDMDQERIERHMTYIHQYLEKVIKNDKRNEFGALNMGALFAEMGYLEEAKDTFYKVRELQSDIQELHINLGHVHLCQEQFDHAIKSYERALNRTAVTSHHNGQLTKQYKVHLFLARAYFESNRLDKCEETMQRAIELAPNKAILMHDLGVVQFERAVRFLKDTQKTVDSTKSAQRWVEQAKSNFEQVALHKKVKDVSLQSKAKQFAAKCLEVAQRVQEILVVVEEEAKREAEEKEQKLQEKRAIDLEMKKKEEEELSKQREEGEKLLAKQEELRKERQRLCNIFETITKKKSKKEDQVSDEEAENKESTPKRGKKSKKNKKNKRKDKASALTGSSETAGTQTPTKKRKRLRTTRKEEEEEEEEFKEEEEEAAAKEESAPAKEEEEEEEEQEASAEKEEEEQGNRAQYEGEEEFVFGNEDNKQQTSAEASGTKDDEPKPKRTKTEETDSLEE